VQARPGYMALPAKADDRPAPRKIDAEVLAPDDHNDAPATFAVTVAGAEVKTVSAVLHVDLKNLEFKESFGIHNQKLTYIVALMDEQGNFVAGQENQIDLALKAETLAKYRDGGLNLAAQLKAPKGSYKLRAVVEVAGDGKTTSATTPVEIP
jgi:hypothetical protein